MSIIENLIYPSANHVGKLTDSTVFNLGTWWHGDHIARRFTRKPDGVFHFLLLIDGEICGFEFKPEQGSDLAWWCDYFADSGKVKLDVRRRRLNGVLMPRVRGIE
ncbi:MAG: hypothetical protein M1572_06570 [Gammaproteobacteria bacterium]|nr:hypothetical protein [Gammaproteobacteria bacterium]